MVKPKVTRRSMARRPRANPQFEKAMKQTFLRIYRGSNKRMIDYLRNY